MYKEGLNDAGNDTRQYPSGRSCPECGREIMLYDIPMINVTRKEIKCQCVTDREAQERRERITCGTTIVRQKMREVSGMGKRYQLYTFGRFKRNENNGAALDAALQFVEDYCTGQAPRGLMFCGTAGTGKTFLSCAIANAIIDKYPVDEKRAEDEAQGLHALAYYSPITFFGTADLMQRIRSSFNGYGAGENGASLVEQCKRAKFLILDDFGAEKISDWVREVVYDIVEHRWQNLMHTVLTTNEATVSLKEKYGERIADRVRNMCAAVPMTGKSQRKTAMLSACTEQK